MKNSAKFEKGVVSFLKRFALAIPLLTDVLTAIIEALNPKYDL